MLVQPFGFLAAPAGAVDPILTELTLWVDASDSTSYPGTGGTWTDLSTFGRNQTLFNAPTFDATNKIFEFNGSNQYSDYTDASFFEFFDTSDNNNWAVTYESVFRLDDITGANEPIMTRWNSVSTSSQRIILTIELGKVRLGLRSNGGSSAFPLSATTVSAGWHHIVMTVERSGGADPTYAVYVDNSSIMSGTWSGFSGWHAVPGSSPMSIGRTKTPQHMDGGIAMARIYNQALSTADRTHNYDLAKSIWTSIP